MRNILLRMVTPVAALAIGSALLAQDHPDEQERLIALIEAIYEGISVDEIVGLPELDENQVDELERLAGCTPTAEQHANALIPILDWHCESIPDDSRTIAFYLSNGGGIVIQPLAANFRPTDRALATASLPNYRRLTRQFLSAVRAGEDPTLSGVIPITAMQLELLEVARGKHFQKMSGSNRSSQVHLWPEALSEQGPLITDLRFDDEGIPVGLVISYGMAAN